MSSKFKAGTFPVNLLTTPAPTFELSGLRAWYDANDKLFEDSAKTIPCEGCSSISVWEDKSGNNHHLVQTATSKKPVFKKYSTSNFKSFVRFDGIDDEMSSSVPFQQTLSGDCSAFIVFKSVPTQAGSGSTRLLSLNFDNSFTNQVYLGHGNGDLSSNEDNLHISIGNSTIISSPSSVANNEWNLLTITRTGSAEGSVVVNLNRKEIINDNWTASAPTSIEPTSFVLGGDSTNGFLDGDIGEVMVYGSKLSEPQRISVESWLQRKWNIGQENGFAPIGGFLSLCPNPKFAFSLRKLAFGGSSDICFAVNIQRSAVGPSNTASICDVVFDPVAQEITMSSKVTNFVGGSSTAKTLGEFVGVGSNPDGLSAPCNAGVRVWYDQSGNGYDAFNNTTGPSLIQNGVLNTHNGRPALVYQPSLLNSEIVPPFDLSSSSLFVVADLQDPNSYEMILQFRKSGGVIPITWRRAGNTLSEMGGTTNINNLHALFEYHAQPEGLQKRIKGYINNNLDANTLRTADFTGANQVQICGVSNAMVGIVQEVLIYDENKETVRTTVYSNLSSHYNLP